jgi:hypothetical protein
VPGCHGAGARRGAPNAAASELSNQVYRVRGRTRWLTGGAVRRWGEPVSGPSAGVVGLDVAWVAHGYVRRSVRSSSVGPELS